MGQLLHYNAMATPRIKKNTRKSKESIEILKKDTISIMKQFCTGNCNSQINLEGI